MTHSKDSWVTDTSDACTRSTRPIPASTMSTPARRNRAPTASPIRVVS